MTTRRLGPFELGERLGAGGMGEVYRATHHRTGKVVALKVIRADLIDNPRVTARFAREVRILKKLRHPNIVGCYGGSVEDGAMFYAMRLLEGGSLASLLKRRGRLPWETAVKYALQICDALECAHEHHVVHRDLKPSNLLFSKKSGRLKLSDFGLARHAEATALTVAGRAIGTCSYTAPELIRGFPPASHKSDLYSLGCVLFEMLTGRRPFEAASHAEVFYKHLEETPTPVRAVAMECPIWLEALVAQLLAKDPADRPHDAGVVRHALIEVQEKVSAQSSFLEHSLSGGASALHQARDMAGAKQLVARKKRRKNSIPFYERTWFLAACLALLAAFFTWAAWPPGEAELFAQGQQLMESEDPVAWYDARDRYLEPYLERFPDGPHAAEVREYLDRIEMRVAERRFRANLRLGREPRSEAERLFGRAWRYEQFGDRVTALEEYESMLHLLESDTENADENRPYVNLARRQIAALRDAAGEESDRRRLLDVALAEADAMYREGNEIEARLKWRSIVTLYAGNRELRAHVERASARLANPEAALSDEQSPSNNPVEDAAAPVRETARHADVQRQRRAPY